MDYLTFIDDIDKIWTEEKNSKLAQKYSMNRSVLPALINLHREWTSIFDSQSNKLSKLELELNHYKNNDNLVQNVELEKKVKELKKVVAELQEESYKNDKKIRILESQNSDLQNRTIFQKLVG